MDLNVPVRCYPLKLQLHFRVCLQLHFRVRLQLHFRVCLRVYRLHKQARINHQTHVSTLIQVPDAIRLVEHLHYTRELAAKVRDTLLAQQADHAIDRLHTAKERVGVPPNPAARDGTRLVQLCRPTQVNAVATTSLWCRLRCLHRPVIWCRPRCLLVCLRRFLSLRPMPWEKRSARRISTAR